MGLSRLLFGKHFVPGFKTNFVSGFLYFTVPYTLIGVLWSRIQNVDSYREKLAEEYRMKQRDMVEGKK